MKKTTPLMIFLSFLILFGFGCARTAVDENKVVVDPEKQIDRNAVLLEARQEGLIMDTPEMERMKDPSVLVQDVGVQKNTDIKSPLVTEMKTWRAGALADVTGGGSFGLVHTQFKDSRFTLVATLGGLPIPGNGSSYEGWLVQRGNEMKVLNTGSVETNEDMFENVYLSAEDFSSYDFFVITLQLATDNGQPGEHILEGVIR